MVRVIAPTLFFAWGNPSRGDDALGPLFIEAMQAQVADHPEWGQNFGEIEFLTDFQLQVEHALDLRGRRRVLFADAHAQLDAPCTLSRITPRADASISSHALSPHALLQVWTQIEFAPPPPCWLLAMRAEAMELGSALSPGAQASLDQAVAVASAWLVTPTD